MSLKTLTLLITLFTLSSVHAQTDTLSSDTSHWIIKGLGGLNFSQVSLKNWTGGGQSAVSGTAIVNLSANYKGERSLFENTLNMAYGLQKQDVDGVRKTDDRIDFISKYGLPAFNKWFYSTSLSFRSQFAPGFNYPNDSVEISKFLAPGYVQITIGLENKINDNFSISISPFSSKLTIVNDKFLASQGAFGIDTGKTIRAEYGGSFRLQYQLKIMENVSYSTTLDLFSNYLMSPQNIDVVWANLLSLKVNKYLSASITTNLIYDNDIILKQDENNDGIFEVNGPRTQFKEVVSLGVQYQF